MIDVKTFDEIVQNIINAIHDKVPEADSKEGTFIRDVFIDPIADQMAALSIDMKNVEYSQSILTATGDDLDRLAVNYGLTRKTAQPATGYIRFYIKNITIDFIIQAQTRVATKATYTAEAKVYQTVNTKTYYYIHNWEYPPVDVNSEEFKNQYIAIYTSNLTLAPNGYYYFDIEAKSIEGGELYNTSADTIVNFIDSLDANIMYFTNPIAFTGGTNQESDSDLTLRIKMALQGANIGTKYGYTSYVLKQQDVIDAQVVCAMERDMIRDVYRDYESHHGGDYGIHDGGKVDIYIRGKDLEDDIIEIQLRDDNVFYTDNGYQTPLAVPANLKPITDIKSITYTLTQDDEIINGSFTNVKDYQYELTRINFSQLDTITNNSLRDKIEHIIKRTTMMSIDKSDVEDVQITAHQTYGRLDEIQTIDYNNDLDGGLPIKLSYIYDVDENDPVECPIMFTVDMDEDNNIIDIYIEYCETDSTHEWFTAIPYTVYQIDNGYHYDYIEEDGKIIAIKVANDPIHMIYNKTVDGTKSYFKDSLYDDKYFFADSIDNLVYNEHLLHILEENDCPLNDFFEYINKDEVKQLFLNNLNNLFIYMKDYLYYLDFGKADTETVKVEAQPFLFAQENEGEFKFKINNNSSINSIEFDVLIDNSNLYINENVLPSGWNVDNHLITKHYSFNATEYKDLVQAQDVDPQHPLQIVELADVVFTKNLDADTFMLKFENVNIKDILNNVLQYTAAGITADSEGRTDPAIPVDDVFNLTTYKFKDDIYKARFDFIVPTKYNGNKIVPMYFTKKNNMALHTYYIPDYELINNEQLFFGNSQQAEYFLQWYKNPLDILNGNLSITINFTKNMLIQRLQEEINNIKVLTADVVLKEAQVREIEIICDVRYLDTYSKQDTYNLISSTVANYINNTAMGSTVKLSDLIITIQHIDGVGYVDASTVQLRELYKDPVKQIDLHSYEYMNLVNLVINEIEE